MSIGQVENSLDEIVELANTIVAMRPSQVVITIQDLMFKRELSRTVGELNSLVLDSPDHKQVAAKALAKMGLWLEVSR